MAPHIALHETGAPFEIRPLSFHKREQREPAYLAINPEGKVPTLLVDGAPLTEVAGILFYLARRFPEARLLPGDAEGEARVVSWMSFIAATIHPARLAGEEPVRMVLGQAERRLGDRAWAVGDHMTIADIHLFRLFWRLRNAFGLSAEDYPALTGHHDRMIARPSVQRTFEAETAIGYELPGWKPA